MTLIELCEKLSLPLLLVDEIMEFDRNYNYYYITKAMDKIFLSETWAEGIEEIKEALGDDKRGVKMLSCMLRCALKTYDNYRNADVDEEIFINTIKCFTRFVKEHYCSYGIYGFDRYRWTPRQISMKLFRIGQLEYEINTINDENVISIHIPSDATMSRQNLRESYIKAKEFFSKYFPNYEYNKMVCNSWLLSPNLNKILDSNSNIIVFQKSFVITSININEKGYMEWVFKNKNLELDKLPEETTLQRKLKKYLLDGNDLGQAFGYLIKEPFLE